MSTMDSTCEGGQGEITRRDIERGLRSLGLKRGGLVLLHSSLASLGKGVEKGRKAALESPGGPQGSALELILN